MKYFIPLFLICLSINAADIKPDISNEDLKKELDKIELLTQSAQTSLILGQRGQALDSFEQIRYIVSARPKHTHHQRYNYQSGNYFINGYEQD